MGMKRSNDNGGHKASDDVKTLTSKTGTKTDAVQVPKSTAKAAAKPATGRRTGK